MAVVIIELPSLSPTMEKGSVVEWKVKEGDFVSVGQVIACISTDKSTVDYESLDEGYIRKIILKENVEVEVGAIIAVLTEEKDEDFQQELNKALKQQDQKQEKQEKESVDEKANVEVNKRSIEKSSSNSINLDFVACVEPPKVAPLQQNKPKVKATPVAKKIAKDRNINLLAIKKKGRIVAKDVEDLPNNYGMNLAESSSSLVGYINRAKNPFSDIEMSMMRKSISERMVKASLGVPTFYLQVSVNTDNLINLRNQLNETQNIKISFNDFIVKASGLALRKFPEVNSAYQGDHIKQFNDVDISVAVSISDGLITPIVRSADTKGLVTINKEVKQLVKKAYENQLELFEYQGGSFTISNLGMYNVEEFTAILNPPQSAILAVGGISKKLVMDNGVVKETSEMKLTLTSDHRIIDGVLAAEFSNCLKQYLENPAQLIL